MTDKKSILTMTVVPDDTGQGNTVNTTVHKPLDYHQTLNALNAIAQTVKRALNELIPPDETN